METLSCSIEINSTVENVWKKMLEYDTYTIWTKPFHPYSNYEGSWEQGNEIKFVATAEDGTSEGMYSIIKENKPFERISIEHKGIIKNGVVYTEGEDVEKWVPTYENYNFNHVNGVTTVDVEMQVPAECISDFLKTWEKALKELKTLCETNV